MYYFCSHVNTKKNKPEHFFLSLKFDRMPYFLYIENTEGEFNKILEGIMRAVDTFNSRERYLYQIEFF